MVRAILNGSKTQTRRVVKDRHIGQIDTSKLPGPAGWSRPMPYGKPGDRLWVRETWQSLHNQNGERLDGLDDWKKHPRECFYRADESDPSTRPMSGRWRPSIHMPRWASRITLEVTGVRVERLQDIIVADAMAEGVVECAPHLRGLEPCMDWRYAYEDLWVSINGPGSWEANPLVWVVEFLRESIR
jgi:hypothetical protein